MSSRIEIEIAAMLSRSGLYVIGNPMFPLYTGTVVVMGADEKAGVIGRVFELTPGRELSTDPEHWAQMGTYVAGGPYSIQQCEEDEREEDERENQQIKDADELTFWRNFAAQALPFLTSYAGILSRLKMEAAEPVQALIDSVKPLEEQKPNE